MANIINATSTGNGGLITTGDDSGILNIQTNETTAVSVDASQNLTFTNAINAPNTFGFKNRIINGGMTVDQRSLGTQTQSGTALQYPCDRFYTQGFSSAGVYTSQISSDAPAGFNSSVLLTVTTAATPSGTNVYRIIQRIEGYNTADLNLGTVNAKAMTLSFWVKSSLTGTFGGSLWGGSATAWFPFSYTINSANTWEYKTVSIGAATTTPSTAFNTTTGVGLQLTFNIGAGSSVLTTPGSWIYGSTEYYGPTGQTNLIATNGATWYITGVQLEKGTQATSFDFRDYGSELAMCQRYYYKIFPGSTNKTFGMGFAGGSTTAYAYIAFQTTMRTSPGALEQSGTASDYMIAYGGTSTNCNAVPAIINASQDGSNVVFSVASGLTTGDGVQARTSSGTGASAYLAWSAEL